MHVRAALPADLPRMAELMRELAAFEKLPGPDEAAQHRLAQDLGRRFDGFVAIDERAGAIVGYAIHYETYSNFAARPVLWLEDIYVTPDARRGGVATALFREVEREAKRRGCAKVAWAVLGWNVDAQRFYEKLGATRKDWLWYELAQ
jgi:GNAT superfamily N-acetyltransferase